MHVRDTHLVDGNNLLYRAAHAIAAMDGTRGEPVFDERTISFFLKLVKVVLQKLNGRRCCVIWDGGHSKRRIKLFPEYKEDRSSNHRIGLLKMVRSMSPILMKLGCRVFCLPNREADDVIALLVREIGGGTVISTDKDMLQLVSKGAAVYLHASSDFVAGEFFESRYGIDPDRYLLVRAISGDPSDSIPGIMGIGIKTASVLIKKAEEYYTPIRSAKDLFRAVNLIPIKKRGKRERWLLESGDTVRRNMALMDLSAEMFTHSELDKIQASMGSPRRFDQSVVDDLELLGVYDIVGQFDIWSIPFRGLV